MKTYSMNDIFYYKLTPKGKEIMENRFEKSLGGKYKIEYYSGEWIKDQIWCVFQLFGGQTTWGGDVLIYDITFDDPKRGWSKMKYTFLDLLKDFENGVRPPKDSLLTRIFIFITKRDFLDDTGVYIKINRDWYDDLLYIKKFGIKKWLRDKKEADDFYA
jgi:hypothetical protein